MKWQWWPVYQPIWVLLSHNQVSQARLTSQWGPSASGKCSLAMAETFVSFPRSLNDSEGKGLQDALLALHSHTRAKVSETCKGGPGIPNPEELSLGQPVSHTQTLDPAALLYVLHCSPGLQIL